MAGSYDYPKASRKLKAGEEREIVEEARLAIEEAYQFERDNRREAETDLAFLAGDQWPATVKTQRGTTRPMLTINQLPQFVRQVTNPTREADIAIKVAPVDDTSDPQLAKIFNGLIKQIEYQSSAKGVYVWGHEQQANCGIGWWRVCSDYVDDAVFDQELWLQRIESPLSVYCDPAACEPDRSDAMWMCVLEKWPRRTFQKRYPKAALSDVASLSPTTDTAAFEWASQDEVVVAEYYRKIAVKKTLAQLESGEVIDVTGKGEAELGQLDQLAPIVGVREVDSYRVEKFLVSGLEVLEGPIDWPSKYIPLIPVIGAEIPLKNGIVRYGVVRFARDPQQMVNFYETAAAESIALAPKAPYLVTMEEIGPYKDIWDRANVDNRPYLPFKRDSQSPNDRPSRVAPPETPLALLTQGDRAAEQLKRTTGIYEASLGQRSNETSGIAIAKRQVEGDTANSHFADNLMASLVHTGRILIDMIPKIYDNERVVRILGPNNEEEAIAINKVVMLADGQPVVINDLSRARFDVRVTVGKSFVTKRVEAMSAMLEFAKALPPQAQLLFLDLIAQNSDWPGADELAKRFRSLVPPAALADPNDPNAPKPPGPMDDPTVVAQLEKLAAEIDKIKADTEKSKAEAAKTLTEADQMDMSTLHEIVLPSVKGNQPGQPGVEEQEPPDDFEGGQLAA